MIFIILLLVILLIIVFIPKGGNYTCSKDFSRKTFNRCNEDPDGQYQIQDDCELSCLTDEERSLGINNLHLLDELEDGFDVVVPIPQSIRDELKSNPQKFIDFLINKEYNFSYWLCQNPSIVTEIYLKAAKITPTK